MTKKKILLTIALYIGLCALAIFLDWIGGRVIYSFEYRMQEWIGFLILATIAAIFIAMIYVIIVRRIQRKHLKWLTSLLLFIVAISFDWFRFEIVSKVDSNGVNILLVIAVFYMIAIGFIFSWVAVIDYLLIRKADSRISLIPLKVILAVIVFVLLRYNIPNHSDTYLRINHSVYMGKREEIIELYEKGELTQINEDKFLVPYHLASHDRIVYIQTKKGVTKAVFYIGYGFSADSLIMYISDESMVHVQDFTDSPSYWQFYDIKPLGGDWYSAKMKH